MIKILHKVKMIHEQNKNVNKEVGHIKKNQQLKFVGLKNTIIHLKYTQIGHLVLFNQKN